VRVAMAANTLGLQDAAAFHQSHSDLDSFVGQVRSHDVFVVCERLLME